MFIKSSILALSIAASAFARELIIERDGRPFYPRRFGQEQCGGIGGDIGSACNGAVCGVLGGRVPSALLAGAAECAQQDLADDIIDASKDQDAATAARMVELAIRFRQCEKNTPPDFSTNPPTLRNSVFCQRQPRNSQLVGLNQAQDPANDPDLFFDPATRATVRRGEQANTIPLGGGNAQPAPPPPPVVDPEPEVAPTEAPEADATGTCPPAVTVTVTAGESVNTAAPAPVATPAPAPAPAPAPPAAGGALDFGSCTNPAVEFGPAFEGRKLSENTFQPQNKGEFPQSSALNGQIVLNAICNILNDRCRAPAATVAACQAAVTAVANVAGGAKADQFNAALGIVTNFATIPAAPGGGPGSIELATTANFNKCDVPVIQFGIFDGRTENSFAPSGNGFVHGSALNGNIITKFVCDRVQSTCDANTVAINDCNAAITATQGLTGQAFADAFNAAVAANV